MLTGREKVELDTKDALLPLLTVKRSEMALESKGELGNTLLEM